jgi:hypothetical protein
MCDPAPNTRVVPPLDKAVVSSHVVVGADGAAKPKAMWNSFSQLLPYGCAHAGHA